MNIIEKVANEVSEEVKDDIFNEKDLKVYGGIAIIFTIIGIIIELIRLYRDCNKTPEEAHDMLNSFSGRRKIQSMVLEKVKRPILSRIIALSITRRLRRLSLEEVKEGFASVPME